MSTPAQNRQPGTVTYRIHFKRYASRHSNGALTHDIRDTLDRVVLIELPPALVAAERDRPLDRVALEVAMVRHHTQTEYNSDIYPWIVAWAVDVLVDTIDSPAPPPHCVTVVGIANRDLDACELLEGADRWEAALAKLRNYTYPPGGR